MNKLRNYKYGGLMSRAALNELIAKLDALEPAGVRPADCFAEQSEALRRAVTRGVSREQINVVMAGYDRSVNLSQINEFSEHAGVPAKKTRRPRGSRTTPDAPTSSGNSSESDPHEPEAQAPSKRPRKSKKAEPAPIDREVDAAAPDMQASPPAAQDKGPDIDPREIRKPVTMGLRSLKK